MYMHLLFTFPSKMDEEDKEIMEEPRFIIFFLSSSSLVLTHLRIMLFGFDPSTNFVFFGFGPSHCVNHHPFC